jgi:hypothetical protein
MAELSTENITETHAPALVTCCINCCLSFLSFLVWPLLPTHCRYRSLLLCLTTLIDTPQSVGLLWTSDRPVAETTTLTRDTYPCPRRDSNPQPQQASGRRPTAYRLSPWDRIHVCWLPCAGLDTYRLRVVRCHATLVFWTPHFERAALTFIFCPNCKLQPHYKHLILLDLTGRYYVSVCTYISTHML